MILMIESGTDDGDSEGKMQIHDIVDYKSVLM